MLTVNVYNDETIPLKLKEEYELDEITHLLIVEHNNKIIFSMTDNMEPEDVTFYRDLSDIPDIIQKAYELGRKDERDEEYMHRKILGEKGLL